MSDTRCVGIHVGALPDMNESADIAVSRGAIGYRVRDTATIAHHVRMSRDELVDLVLVSSRLLDAWAIE